MSDPLDDLYIIDAVEGVQFKRRDAPTLNFQALEYGPVGLEQIARSVWEHEQRLGKKWTFVLSPGDDEASGVLNCYFYWFAVALVNHTRLVGMLTFLHRNQLRDAALLEVDVRKRAVESTNAYVKLVIPDVLAWRNKVGAHYAFTDPRKDDTLHDIQQSVMMNVAFVRNRWRACGLRWGEATIPEWSITEEMERLAPRFWPGFTLHR